MKKYLHDTYEATLDDVHIEIVGTSTDDAQQSLKEWLDAYTNGYKLKGFKFKRNGI